MPLVKAPRQYVQRPPPLLGAKGTRKLLGSILMIGGFFAMLWGASTLASEFVNLDLSYASGQWNVNLKTVIPSAIAVLAGIWFFRLGLMVFLAPNDEKAMREVKRLGFP